MKTRKRTMAAIAAMTMALSSIPLTAMPLTVHAGSNWSKFNTGVTTLGTSVIGAPSNASSNTTWTGNYVYYGKYNSNSVKYRVLDPESTDYYADSNHNNHLSTLLLDCDSILTTGAYGQTYQWQNCTLLNWLNGTKSTDFLNSSNFTNIEKNAIPIVYRYYTEDAISNYKVINVAYDKQVFVLDIADVTNTKYGYADSSTKESKTRSKSDSQNWWLRSRKNSSAEVDKKTVGTIQTNGNFSGKTTTDSYGYSPAFNVLRDSIVFTSKVNPDNEGTYGNEYKLTLKDTGFGIGVTTDAYVTANGSTVTVPYTVTDTDEKLDPDTVSVLIQSKTDNSIIYYAPLSGTYAASGTGTFTLPSSLNIDEWGTNYTVSILAEDVNGQYETDYASAPVEIGVSKHEVSVSAASNGTVAADKTENVIAGNTVTLTVTPAEGYAVKSVTAGSAEVTKVDATHYTFTMPDEDVTVTAEFEEPISSASLTLGDDLGLNFYMSSAITEENAADYTVKFEGECLENEATLTKNESTGKYYATAHVYAKNLDKKITAKLYKGEDVICTTEYSVADYLENAPANVTDEKALALIKATKAFGAMSADYFYEGDHDFSDAYNAYLTQSGLTDADIVNNAKNNYATEFTTDDAKISLVLDEKTAIRLYVKGVQPDGENLKPSKQANKDVYPSYYEIAGLTPDKLADEQTVTIGGTEYKFSALSWANRILNQENPSEKNLNMAKAVTAYYLAAHDYYVDQHTVDLSQLTAGYYAKDGDILTGTTDKKIYVYGGTVTLKDAEAQNSIYCGNNSTILLEGTNQAKINVGYGTLTIDGEGSLTANGTSNGAGIGGSDSGNLIINGGNITATGGSQAAGIGGAMTCGFGDITINGGNITAIGGDGCPGIGTGTNSGSYYKCGDITINGGTVTAIGSNNAPGIGSVFNEECGNITIADTVEKVTVIKGEIASSCIGTDGCSQTKCGTITIDGKVYYNNGAYVNGGDTYLAQDTIVYEVIDLSKLTEDYTAKNGNILTGELKENVKISVADGATVTLKDVTINGVNDDAYKWAGISCDGNAKLILEGKNNVKGFYKYYPGVYIAPEKTLTIDGTGTLNVNSNGYGAGIGGGDDISSGNIVIDGGVINASGGGEAAGIGGAHKSKCGNITINSGTITATGGYMSAGIGSGNYGSCTYITINGGTVTAIGGNGAAGIGSGHFGKCSDITISDIVTKVIATKGSESPNSIGAGYGGTCGTVTIAEGANVEQN